MKYDENGRIIFTEIVKTTDLTTDQILKNAAGISDIVTLDANTFQKDLKLDLYKVHISKSPHGELEFKLNIDIKENRYRYFFSDFTFYPLERNRYGRFVRVKNRSSILRELLEKPDKTWTKHQKTIEERVESLSSKLKEQLLVKAHESKKEKVILNDDW